MSNDKIILARNLHLKKNLSKIIKQIKIQKFKLQPNITRHLLPNPHTDPSQSLCLPQSQSLKNKFITWDEQKPYRKPS